MTHTIVRDVIAQVQGQGWAFGLARILIDSEGNAAVFVPPGNEPVQTFRFTAGSDMAGTGEDSDGNRVTYKRRTTSCGFALAKCHFKTQILTDRWDSFDAGQMQLVGESGPEITDL